MAFVQQIVRELISPVVRADGPRSRLVRHLCYFWRSRNIHHQANPARGPGPHAGGAQPGHLRMAQRAAVRCLRQGLRKTVSLPALWQAHALQVRRLTNSCTCLSHVHAVCCQDSAVRVTYISKIISTSQLISFFACSDHCQKLDWSAGHKVHCGKIGEELFSYDVRRFAILEADNCKHVRCTSDATARRGAAPGYTPRMMVQRMSS